MTSPEKPASSSCLRRALGVTVTLLLVLAVLVRSTGTGPHKIAPARDQSDPFAHGTFAEGAYPPGPSDLPADIRGRGSYISGDAFRGSFTSGWYGRSSRVVLLVAGYPHNAGNSLRLDVQRENGTVESIPFQGTDPAESWRPWKVALPADATGFQIVAIDGSSAYCGWLAVSEPFKPNGTLSESTQAVRSLLAFGVQGLLLVALALMLNRGLGSRLGLTPSLLPLVIAAGVALLGYVAFWVYFASPTLGRGYSWIILVAAALSLWWKRSPREGGLGPDAWRPLGLAAAIGLGVIALTCLFERGSFSHLVENRFVTGMPADNMIPSQFADRLWTGQSPRQLIGDWLSSDRPPLQTGWVLLTRPVMMGLGFDPDTADSAGGICFQLLWVPALWALLRSWGAGVRQTGAVIAAMSFTGFFLFFTVFTWPKLGAAGLVVAAFLLWWTGPVSKQRFALGGLCAGLGWLAHGGVAFSLLGLAPLVCFSFARHPSSWRPWLAAAGTFLVVALPWSAYQKFYEPPGDRLLKMHLAGVSAPDTRPFTAALVESYRKIGWRQALDGRAANLRRQWVGDWRGLATFHLRESVPVFRWNQFAFTGFAFGWWACAILLVPWALYKQSRRGQTGMLRTFIWLILGWGLWIALMFLPDSAIVHQGTLLTELLGFALLAWAALETHWIVFALLATLQALAFLLTWVPGTPAVTSNPDPLATMVAIAAGYLLLRTALAGAPPDQKQPDPSLLATDDLVG